MDICNQCPLCHKNDKTYLMSTMNEWKYYCSRCDIRFSEQDEVLAGPGTL